MKRPMQYILVDKTPVVCGDLIQWAIWMETAHEQRIVKQENINDLFVSTAFLGLDHNYIGKGPPLLFETMVFWKYKKPVKKYIFGKLIELNREALEDMPVYRYSTWDEALAGHEAIVKEARMRYFKEVNGNG